MPAASLVSIDGSRGEGGGGVLRTALIMSALTEQPLKIEYIRGGTNHPGLDFEDLTLVRALARSTLAETVGAELGATSLSFLPTKRPSSLNGALDLPNEPSRRNPNSLVVLSSLVPVLARSGMYSQISLQGETYGHRALTFDYFANVAVPALSRFGLGVFPDMERAGFGRESSGQVKMDVEPSGLHGVEWSERGKLIAARALIVTAGVPGSVGGRGVAHLSKLASSAKVEVEVEAAEVESSTAGAFVTVWAEYERGFGGATAMGSRGLRMETLVQTACEELLAWMQSPATVDPFLADQILIPAALADTASTFKVSELTARFLSSVSVVKQFLPIHITVRGAQGEPGTVTVRR